MYLGTVGHDWPPEDADEQCGFGSAPLVVAVVGTRGIEEAVLDKCGARFARWRQRYVSGPLLGFPYEFVGERFVRGRVVFVVEEHGDLGGSVSGDADGRDEDRVGADAVEDRGAVAVENEAGTGVSDVGAEDDGCPVTRHHAGRDLSLCLEFDVATHHYVR
ncbi:MAG: hypothetical protein Q8M22_05625 [Actinomycetota bacterium]|nr:hypothetical protein [Actinomycetota bacterium]